MEASMQDATGAALRRKNQSKLAGLRHNQAPRQATAPASEAADARLTERKMLNMRKV
jgi:hypothetical protein